MLRSFLPVAVVLFLHVPSLVPIHLKRLNFKEKKFVVFYINEYDKKRSQIYLELPEC